MDEFNEEEIEMKHPAYHLKPNKAVDRLLFLEILRQLKVEESQLRYYTLAGPFLEDMKVVYAAFPNMQIHSLEKSKHTLERQKFHRFSSRLQLLPLSLQAFLNDYEGSNEGHDIFWLDYTGLEHSHFEEFGLLLGQSLSGTIIRITLRAQPDVDIQNIEQSLGDPALIATIKVQLQKKFEEKYGSIYPYIEENEDLLWSRKGFAKIVQKMVERKAIQAMSSYTTTFLPLQSLCYTDDTQMLSITGIVSDKDKVGHFKEQFATIRFSNFDWESIHFINLPILSLKERLHLEGLLPIEKNGEAKDKFYDQLPYNIADGQSASKRMLAEYASYHQEYPNFIRISM